MDVDLLTRLAESGVTPGASVQVERAVGVVTVAAPGAELLLELPDDVARHLFVRRG